MIETDAFIAVTPCSLSSLILMTDTQILRAVHKMVSNGYVADIQADVETLIETQWAIQKEQDRVTRCGIAAQRRAAKREGSRRARSVINKARVSK